MTKKLSFLIESEIEKAELVIASKAISEKLQKMAEDLAKVEAQELMPMSDSLKMAFGQQMAQSFSETVTNQLRNLLMQITTAKGGNR